MSQANGAPPGTPWRVREVTTAQIDNPVEAKSVAAWSVVGQNIEGIIINDAIHPSPTVRGASLWPDWSPEDFW